MQRRQRQAQRRRQRRWRWGLSGGFLLTALLLIGGITAQRSAPTTSNPLEAMENLFIGPPGALWLANSLANPTGGAQ